MSFYKRNVFIQTLIEKLDISFWLKLISSFLFYENTMCTLSDAYEYWGCWKIRIDLLSDINTCNLVCFLNKIAIFVCENCMYFIDIQFCMMFYVGFCVGKFWTYMFVLKGNFIDYTYTDIYVFVKYFYLCCDKKLWLTRPCTLMCRLLGF